VTRLSTMPTIPDEPLEDITTETFGGDPESDHRCKLGQVACDELDAPLPANRELSIPELMRRPTLLNEWTSLGLAAQLFASGMEEPAVIVTDSNKPLGLLDPARVLRAIKGRTLQEITETRVFEVIPPFGLRLDEDTSLEEAARRFVADDCDALIVVKQNGELAGVLLARDVFLLWV
jgi:predicted transcriptional regulator